MFRPTIATFVALAAVAVAEIDKASQTQVSHGEIEFDHDGSSSVATLIVVRHAESKWNEFDENYIGGGRKIRKLIFTREGAKKELLNAYKHKNNQNVSSLLNDPVLSQKGVMQSIANRESLEKALKGIQNRDTLSLVSPLCRTLETAAIMTNGLEDLPPFKAIPSMKEVGNGADLFTWKTVSQLQNLGVTTKDEVENQQINYNKYVDFYKKIVFKACVKEDGKRCFGKGGKLKLKEKERVKHLINMLRGVDDSISYPEEQETLEKEFDFFPRKPNVFKKNGTVLAVGHSNWFRNLFKQVFTDSQKKTTFEHPIRGNLTVEKWIKKKLLNGEVVKLSVVESDELDSGLKVNKMEVFYVEVPENSGEETLKEKEPVEPEKEEEQSPTSFLRK